MIDFNTFSVDMPHEWTDEELEEDQAYYARLVEQVKLAMSKVGASKYELGLELLRLYESKVYVSDSGWIYPYKNANGKYFSRAGNYEFFSECEKKFNLDKSQVSRYINIVDEFGDRENGLKPEWAAYSWSQLVELLPLTSEERAKITPEMTIKAIREYKEKLVATSQQEEKTENWNVKSVATSQ